MSTTDRVAIRISYNGGWWRHHVVSRGFLERLQAYIAERPYLDTVIEEL